MLYLFLYNNFKVLIYKHLLNYLRQYAVTGLWLRYFPRNGKGKDDKL
ncbi:MAG: hypothetical protein BWY08_00151 [Bacteroidetes bacterium ADurb.Bin174]|nr:MAG: hypothetical protein BWY08_00151 [Bacteroidetes bacterium ADurb.Bin174]